MKKINLRLILNRLKDRWRQLDRDEFRQKLISLGIAVGLHLALILYLRQAKVIIKILPFSRETEVIIATYPEARLPEIPQVIREAPTTEAEIPPTPGEKFSGRPGRAGTQAGVSGAGPVRGKREAETTEKPSIPFDLDAYLASGSSEYRTESGVRINLSRIRPTSGKYSFSLKLPVRPEPPSEAGTRTETPSLKGDLYRYSAPGSYQQPGKGLRFTETGRPRPGIPGTMTGQVIGYRYQIRPWAERVVNLIQSKWVLPQLAVMPKNKNIAMILVVDREGQLLSLEITTSTTSEILDQAAVAAVRLCNPFPPLPPDFPGKSLEFYLVFTYHD